MNPKDEGALMKGWEVTDPFSNIHAYLYTYMLTYIIANLHTYIDPIHP